jgi:hypothetical protein
LISGERDDNDKKRFDKSKEDEVLLLVVDDGKCCCKVCFAVFARLLYIPVGFDGCCLISSETCIDCKDGFRFAFTFVISCNGIELDDVDCVDCVDNFDLDTRSRNEDKFYQQYQIQI